MLRFLRRVRLNSLGNLGFKKYFFYALGEVVLIVIGVLLALQLNNWNNFRLNRFQEKQILVRLAQDLDSSVTRISTMKRAVTRKENALKRIEPTLSGQPPNDKKRFLNDVLVAASFGWEQPKLEHVTFDEIVSSGRISLIHDANLRLSLTRFFHTVEQREQRSTVRITDFPKITYRFLPRGESDLALEEGLSEEKTDAMFEAILASDLKDYLIPELNRARFMVSIWEDMESQIKELRAHILEVPGIEERVAQLDLTRIVENPELNRRREQMDAEDALK